MLIVTNEKKWDEEREEIINKHGTKKAIYMKILTVPDMCLHNAR